MAGASFKGDFEKLRRLIAGVSKLTKPAFKREANRRLSQVTMELVHESFEKAITPEGAKWKPLKYRRGGQPLRDTGRLLASIKAVAHQQSFTVITNVIYGATHQYGHGPVPRRQYLPNPEKLAPRYRKAYIDVLTRMRDEALHGSR